MENQPITNPYIGTMNKLDSRSKNLMTYLQI